MRRSSNNVRLTKATVNESGIQARPRRVATLLK